MRDNIVATDKTKHLYELVKFYTFSNSILSLRRFHTYKCIKIIFQVACHLLDSLSIGSAY